jgi:uncharacterized membrane protein YdbT with pleckstrin-like domain
MSITEAQYPISHYYFSKLWIMFLGVLLIGAFLIRLATMPGVAGTNGYNPNTGRNNFSTPIALYVIGGFLILGSILIFINILNIRAYFHYAIDDQGVTLTQGFSRKQQTMPYGAVKKVWVSQGPLDGIFGIATLYVRNEAGLEASKQIQEQASLSPKNILIGGMSRQDAMVATTTATSNTIIISGLLRQDAEALKDLIASKMVT